LNTATTLILGVAAMLLMAVGIIMFVILYQRRVIQSQIEIERINREKQQELINASIQSEEQERMRLAAELHDDIAPTLASIKLFLSTAMNKTRQSDQVELILLSNEMLNETLRKIRDIAHKLQPATLHFLGLQTSLQALTEMINKSGSIELRYSCDKPLPRLDAKTELSLYRISQELINNIIKHAGAHLLSIKTSINDDLVLLNISHDGIGITQQLYEELIYKKGAIGFKNIVSRLESIKAVILFEQVSVRLFTITIQAPVIQQSN
jgi:two-component system NarL family sensor kinase